MSLTQKIHEIPAIMLSLFILVLLTLFCGMVNMFIVLASIPYEYPRFTKFAVVGGTGVIVHFGILYGLTTAGIIYWVSAMVAIVIAMMYNYTFNNIWTFRAQRRQGTSFLRGLGKYAVVSFTGDGLYLGLMVLLTEKAHFYYMLSACISMFSIMILRYIAVRKFVWGARCVKQMDINT